MSLGRCLSAILLMRQALIVVVILGAKQTASILKWSRISLFPFLGGLSYILRTLGSINFVCHPSQLLLTHAQSSNWWRQIATRAITFQIGWQSADMPSTNKQVYLLRHMNFSFQGKNITRKCQKGNKSWKLKEEEKLGVDILLSRLFLSTTMYVCKIYLYSALIMQVCYNDAAQAGQDGRGKRRCEKQMETGCAGDHQFKE